MGRRAEVEANFLYRLNRPGRIFPLLQSFGRKLSKHGVPALDFDIRNAPVGKHRRLSHDSSLEVAIPEEIRILGLNPPHNCASFLPRCLGIDDARVDLKQHEHQRQERGYPLDLGKAAQRAEMKVHG